MKSVLINRDHGKLGKEVFLTSVANEREYEVYKSLLKAYGIPVLKKQREAGGYLNISMGMNVYGVDIYVPEKYYKAALNLVKDDNSNNKDYDNEVEIEKEKYYKKRLIYIWIIIAIFYVPVLIWLIYTLIANIFK